MSKTNEATPSPPSSSSGEGRIVDSALGLKEEAIALLLDLVREPSLLGQEAGAQAVVRRAFERVGVDVHEFPIDEAKLRQHPGYSPSIVS